MRVLPHHLGTHHRETDGGEDLFELQVGRVERGLGGYSGRKREGERLELWLQRSQRCSKRCWERRLPRRGVGQMGPGLARPVVGRVRWTGSGGQADSDGEGKVIGLNIVLE